MLTNRQIDRINEVIDNIDGIDIYSKLYKETEGESKKRIRSVLENAIKFYETHQDTTSYSTRRIRVGFFKNDHLDVSLFVGHWNTGELDE